MEKLFENADEVIFVRGDTVDIANNVYFIKSGTVGLYSLEDGNRSFLFAYKSGEIFPYSGYKDGLLSGRQAEFRAMSNLILLEQPRAKFDKLAFEPENVKEFVESLMYVMRMQIERIDNLGQGHVYKRLLERLIFFSKRLGVVHGDKIIIDTPMSHVDIATSIGSSRETVNRLMRRLEKQGVISVKRQTIVINSIAELKKLLDRPSGRDYGKNLLTVTALTTLIAEAIVSIN